MHIRSKYPPKAGSPFYNYNFFSIILEGVGDSEGRFISIYKGAFGKQSDGGTFSGSTLYHFLEDFESTLTKPASFEGKQNRDVFGHPWG